MSEYNELPSNFREITAAEFWCQFSGYAPTKRDFRQVQLEPGKPLESLIMFWYGQDEGIGFTKCYNHGGSIKDGTHGWCPPMLYFKFGKCVHDWQVHPDSRMCYHVSVCTKCGARNEVDSSG